MVSEPRCLKQEPQRARRRGHIAVPRSQPSQYSTVKRGKKLGRKRRILRLGLSGSLAGRATLQPMFSSCRGSNLHGSASTDILSMSMH
eukprot:11320-Eustigmatos_ZCMA.PRE.1